MSMSLTKSFSLSLNDCHDSGTYKASPLYAHMSMNISPLFSLSSRRVPR